MKKLLLAAFITMVMMSSAYAGEEIQLAAVMTESGASTLTANKKVYAAMGDTRPSGSFGSANKSSNYEYAVITGIAIAGLLAIAVDGNSTSNH
jgi:homoserine dehydrogenase